MRNAASHERSRFLSYVLRHRPGSIGLTLDSAGWVEIDLLLTACAKHGHGMTRGELVEVVRTNPKQRFAIREDGCIRANQGHSVEVDLELAAEIPPAVLFHGTAERFLESILRDGLIRGARHHVHLSADRDTAHQVGRRHGEAIVLSIDAARMHDDGHVFFRSRNGVWLAEHVPRPYLI